MKSNWEKDIHDRLSNYEQDAPNGLWDAVSRKMEEDGYIHANKYARFHPLWRMVSVTAVASVALFFGYTLLELYNNSKDVGRRYPNSATYVKNTDKGGHNTPSQSKSIALVEVVSSNGRKTKINKSIIQSTTSIYAGTFNIDSINNPINSEDKEKPSEKGEENKYDKTNQNHNGCIPVHNLETVSKVHTNGSSRWSVSISTTGEIGWEKTATYIGKPVVSVSPDNTEWQDNPMLSIDLFNQGKEVIEQYKHHLPIRLQAKVAYAFNERFSIESGITYTHLLSDIKNGSEDSYFTGEQKLNYVGIPVGIRYDALVFNRFNLYGAANALLEKCVSGTATNNYVINNSSTQTEVHSLNSKPLQLSVGASVGVQFSVFDNINIYAEPGLRYYFDDQSSIQTIFKEKPINFDISIGVRYTINK